MQDCLTSVHADIARLALVGKYFSQPILNLLYANYTEVSVESSENTKHFLLFYYYGGIIAASVKNFSRYVYGDWSGGIPEKIFPIFDNVHVYSRGSPF